MRNILLSLIFLNLLIFLNNNKLFAQDEFDYSSLKNMQKTKIKVITENGQIIPGANVKYKDKATGKTDDDGVVMMRVSRESVKDLYQNNGSGITVKGYDIQKIDIKKNDFFFLVKVRAASNAMSPVIVRGTTKDKEGNFLKNVTIVFETLDKTIRKQVVTDEQGNFLLQFGNEKEWKDFFAKQLDIIYPDESMEIADAQMNKSNIVIVFKKKDKTTAKTEGKKEEKKTLLKIENAENNSESASQMKDTTERQENTTSSEEKTELRNPEWVKWVELHIRNPKALEEMPEKERKIYIVSQIKLVKNDNKEINDQIKSLEEILKNDTTLSEKEKLNLNDEINKLKRKLYLNGLALGQLENQLSEFEKSFLEKYRNLLLGAIFVVLVLSMIIYLMALLARSRKKQHDTLLLKNKEIEEKNVKITEEQQASEKLLLNILPVTVAQELKKNGKVEPRLYNDVTTLFTDFKGFSGMAKNLTPQQVISQLAFYFEGFEEICKNYRLEKIKTIGDAFMAVAGLPLEYKQHAICAAGAGLAMQRFINDNPPPLATVWGVRIGLHTGEAVAGVIGQSKFAYDIWGNAVNVASRMESAGEAGKVQISSTTYEKVKNIFACEKRGKIEAKNIGDIEAYFITRILPEYSQDKDGFVPNEKFWEATKV